MNKTYLTFIVVAASFTANAQLFIPHLGLTQNHNTETLNFYNAKSGTGFTAGFGFNFKMGERMSFQPEIYYIQKSFSFKFRDSVNYGGIDNYVSNNYSDKYRIGYLEIPLLLKYAFLDKKMFVTLGPYLSIGLGGSDSYAYHFASSSNPTTDRAGKDDIKFGPTPNGNSVNSNFRHRNDVGFQPGVGVVVLKKVQVELRWDFGIKNMYSSRNSRNETLIFLLSYPINLVPEDE